MPTALPKRAKLARVKTLKLHDCGRDSQEYIELTGNKYSLVYVTNEFIWHTTVDWRSGDLGSFIGWGNVIDHRVAPESADFTYSTPNSNGLARYET